jgi:spore maturation protein CgeB
MKFRPHIYGDPGWKQHLNGHAVLRPELNYYEELPDFYGACAVNFNTTSLQMKGGVNQRVFDVPACGSFLLTDYRRQLEQVFEPGREVVCYSSIEEIEDLTAYYVQHEHERRQIAARAHARVLQEHTYVHRLTRLVERMRRLYG